MRTPVCLICVRSYKNETSRDNHGAQTHGAPSAQWKGYAEDYPAVAFERAKPGVRRQNNLPVQPHGAASVPAIDPAEAPLRARTFPPKAEWNQAEGLEALPWVKVPKSPAACDNVAAACGSMAASFDNTTETFGALMSLRDYYLACGARLRKQTAAA